MWFEWINGAKGRKKKISDETLETGYGLYISYAYSFWLKNNFSYDNFAEKDLKSPKNVQKTVFSWFFQKIAFLAQNFEFQNFFKTLIASKHIKVDFMRHFRWYFGLKNHENSHFLTSDFQSRCKNAIFWKNHEKNVFWTFLGDFRHFSEKISYEKLFF